MTTLGPFLKNNVWNYRFAAFKTSKGKIRKCVVEIITQSR